MCFPKSTSKHDDIGAASYHFIPGVIFASNEQGAPWRQR